MSRSRRRGTDFTDAAFACLAVSAAAFIIMIYSDSFHGVFQYDDHANIVENRQVRLESFSPRLLMQSLVRPNSRGAVRVQRPLAYFSFAVNHLVGGFNPWGYHFVNLMIHLCSATLLFFFIRAMLQAPRMMDRYGGHARWIALVAAMLWATHPIQVTAVTYIVQRMAAMAAMFALLSMVLFLKGRLATRRGRRYLLYVLSALAYLAGLASKENVIFIPLCMLILDVGIIRGFGPCSIRRAGMWAGALVLLFGMLIWLVVALGHVNLMDSFPNRPYTPFQRVITQPRVLLIYLLWIFIPMRSRLTMLHDIDFSTDLLNPITTLPAILLLLAGVAGLFMVLKRHPVPAFCGLFFVVNHLVESSFLNLGMMYEHRNYLPSMLVFVPLSIGLIHFCGHPRVRKILRVGCMAALAGMVLSNGHSVYAYNNVFRSQWSLWFDVSLKSPRSSIGQNNLGKVLWDAGAYEKAYEKFNLAMDLDHWADFNEKGMVHHNIGLYHAYITRNYPAARDNFRQTLSVLGDHRATWYQLARAYLLMGRLDEAEGVLTEALSHWPKDVGMALEMAIVQLLAGRMDTALDWAETAEGYFPSNGDIEVVKGEIYRRMGDENQATKCFEAYLLNNPRMRSQLDEMVAAGENSGRVARLLLGLSGIEGRSIIPYRAIPDV